MPINTRDRKGLGSAPVDAASAADDDDGFSCKIP